MENLDLMECFNPWTSTYNETRDDYPIVNEDTTMTVLEHSERKHE
jgi:hypothetical protein